MSMPSSIVRLTVTDHDRVLRLLRRVVTPGPSQDRWRDDVVRLLRAHRAAEKAVLTPDAIEPAGAEARRAITDLAALDAALDEATDRLATTDVASPDLADIGARIESLLGEHATTLDLRVLQPLEAAVARKQIRILGGRYAEVRDADLQDLGGEEPPPRRFDLPRAELYELARKAGIEGRLAMSRGELIAELRRRTA
jgi:hypothetical protein